MRTIKFRGKVKGKCDWVYGSLLVYGDGEYNIHVPRKHNYKLDGWNVAPETVGQYTGLKDGKGNEIYEGDIVNWLSIRNGGIGFVEEGVVEFRVNEQAYVVINRISTKDNRESVCNILRCRRDLKVIGNIYDNPELMKGGAE